MTMIKARQNELDALYSELFRPPAEQPRQHPSVVVDLDDADLIEKALNANDGGKFRRLWDGDITEWNNDDSAADQALCNKLAFWTGRDASRMDRLFRQSGLYRQKWERVDYRERTITKAIAGCAEVYTPARNGTAAVGIMENVRSNAQKPPPIGGASDGECEPGLALGPVAAPALTATTPAPVNGNGKAKRLEEVVDIFRKWLHLPDPGSLYATLGAVAANNMAGDPVWLLNVGVPGGGKTEITQSAFRLPHVFPVGTLTEGALLSGTSKREAAKDAKGGLLRQIGAFGILLVKDFGSILALNRDNRASILMALREIYDGSWTRHVGTDGGRQLHWAGKVGLIGGCTPTIDSHHAVMSILGERFVFYRLPDVDEEQHAQGALKHYGREEEMRAELSAAVSSLFAVLKIPQSPRVIRDDESQWLINLAIFAARCRSAVERDGYTREVVLIPGAEAPSRLVIVLTRLFGGLKVLGLDDTDAYRVVQKVALDSMPRLRRNALALLAGKSGWSKTPDIATELRHPTNTTRRSLEDLEAYGVVDREHGHTDEWRLSDWGREMYAKTQVVPEIQGDVYHSLNTLNTASGGIPGTTTAAANGACGYHDGPCSTCAAQEECGNG